MHSTTAKLLTDARDEAGKAFGQGVEAVKKHTAMWVMRAVGAESREVMMHASNQTLLGIVTRLMAKPPPARAPVVPPGVEPTKIAVVPAPAVAASPAAGASAVVTAPVAPPANAPASPAAAAPTHPVVAALRTITARAAATSSAPPAPAPSDPAIDPHDIAALALLQAKPATLESVQDLVARLGLPHEAQEKVVQELLERDRAWASVVGAQRLTRTRNTGLDASPPPPPPNHSGPARARPAPSPTQPRRPAR